MAPRRLWTWEAGKTTGGPAEFGRRKNRVDLFTVTCFVGLRNVTDISLFRANRAFADSDQARKSGRSFSLRNSCSWCEMAMFVGTRRLRSLAPRAVRCMSSDGAEVLLLVLCVWVPRCGSSRTGALFCFDPADKDVWWNEGWYRLCTLSRETRIIFSMIVTVAVNSKAWGLIQMEKPTQWHTVKKTTVVIFKRSSELDRLGVRSPKPERNTREESVRVQLSNVLSTTAVKYGNVLWKGRVNSEFSILVLLSSKSRDAPSHFRCWM